MIYPETAPSNSGVALSRRRASRTHGVGRQERKGVNHKWWRNVAHGIGEQVPIVEAAI